MKNIVPDLAHAAFSDVKQAKEISIEFSLFKDAYSVHYGEVWKGNLETFSEYLTEEGKIVCKDKRAAPTVTQAISSDGHRSDSSCARITMLFCDADSVGEWDILLAYLDAIGAAYVAHRSSSDAAATADKPSVPKWHLFIPITTPLVPKGENWKQDIYEPQYGWICGVLSEIGRLSIREDCPLKERKYGFDHSIANLIQPAFVGRRIGVHAPNRAVKYSKTGGTLNWDKFLEITGYHEAREAQIQAQAQEAADMLAKASSAHKDNFTQGEFADRLRNALGSCGLLGKRMDDHRQMVLCPWRKEHSDGCCQKEHNQTHSSTVLYETSGGGVVYKCLHAHCTERKARDVWQWIKDHFPGALPHRKLPHKEQPVSTPVETPPAGEILAVVDQIWNRIDGNAEGLPPEKKAYLATAGISGILHDQQIKYLRFVKGIFTPVKSARHRLLAAKAKEAPDSVTTEDQIESLNLLADKLSGKDYHAAVAYRRIDDPKKVVGIGLKRLGDEGHPNNRMAYIPGQVSSGIAGNPTGISAGKTLFIAPNVETYLIAVDGVAEADHYVLGVMGDNGYAGLSGLDLGGVRVCYLGTDKNPPNSAISFARGLKNVAAVPPACVLYAGPGPLQLYLANSTLLALVETATEIGYEKPKQQSLPTDLPEIVLSTDLHQNVVDAITALSALPGLYQQGGRLVHIVEDNDPGAGVWRARRMPEIHAISEAYLKELLAKVARWLKCKEKKNEVVYEACLPPNDVVSSVYSRGVLKGIPELKFITTTPTVRPDGTIISESGYDAATGIVYMPSMVFENIPENPTEKEIVDSAKLLFEVVVDFPFKNQAGRSAWLAGLITRLARFIFDGCTPMFIIDANAPGIGKTRLVNSICLIADGERAAPLRYSGDPDEDEKRILSLLREAAPIAMWDNIDPRKELGHDAIDALLTTTRYKGRILGRSETPTLNNFTVWFATGNNIKMAGDSTRRTLRIVLRTDEENPESRDNFVHPDLNTWILSNRAVLVTAALTLIRGWFAAGKPRQHLKILGGFEEWTASIRQIIVWAGDITSKYGVEIPDPLAANDEDHTGSDERMAALPALLKGWATMCLDDGVPGMSVSEAIEKLRRDSEAPGGGAAPGKYRILRETIQELLPSRGGREEFPSPQKLSHLLRMFKRRISTVNIDGKSQRMQFVNGHADGARFWAAEVCTNTEVVAKPVTQEVTKVSEEVEF